MMRRARRIVAALLIPLMLYWSIVIPRQAYAFAPAGAAPIVIAGTLASGAVVPLLVGAAIAGIAYWAFQDLTSGDEVRVPAVVGSVGVPPPPAAPAVGTPPHTQYSYAGWFDTRAEACQAYAVGNSYTSSTACGGLAGTKTITVVSTAGPCTYTWQCVGTVSGTVLYSGTDSYSPPTQTGCSAGYTMTSGVCNLNDARAAVADGKKDYSRTGAAYAVYSGDQAGSLSSTIMTTTSANDTVYVAGKDASGNAMQGKIVALADGGSKVELKVQKQSASGQSYVETQTYQTSSAGDVVSATQTATAAQLTYNPTTKQYAETAAPAGTAAPDLSAAPQQAITFPSDYARQGEAATAAQSISNTLGPKLDRLVETSPAPADPLLPDPSGYTDFGTTFNGLLGWQLPGHTSQCPTASFTSPWSTSYAIDSHCQLIQNHWGGLQAAMAVVWTILALFVVLRA